MSSDLSKQLSSGSGKLYQPNSTESKPLNILTVDIEKPEEPIAPDQYVMPSQQLQTNEKSCILIEPPKTDSSDKQYLDFINMLSQKNKGLESKLSLALRQIFTLKNAPPLCKKCQELQIKVVELSQKTGKDKEIIEALNNSLSQQIVNMRNKYEDLKFQSIGKEKENEELKKKSKKADEDFDKVSKNLNKYMGFSGRLSLANQEQKQEIKYYQDLNLLLEERNQALAKQLEFLKINKKELPSNPSSNNHSALGILAYNDISGINGSESS